MSSDLKWWRVSGTYAGALVAACTEREAIDFATRGYHGGSFDFMSLAEVEEGLPAEPTAPGHYYSFAE